jgi:nitroreductase
MSLELITSLRATRTFTAAPVQDEQVTAVLEAGRWSGSARNRQPWRFAVVRDRALLRELSLLGAYAGHSLGHPAPAPPGTPAIPGGRRPLRDLVIERF